MVKDNISEENIREIQLQLQKVDFELLKIIDLQDKKHIIKDIYLAVQSLNSMIEKVKFESIHTLSLELEYLWKVVYNYSQFIKRDILNISFLLTEAIESQVVAIQDREEQTIKVNSVIERVELVKQGISINPLL